MNQTLDRPNLANATARLLRRWILAIFVLGVVGIATELALVSHFDSLGQWIPLVLLGASLTVLAWRIVDRGRVNLRVFQIVMVLCVLSGVLGTYLHFNTKLEYQPEGLSWSEKACKAIFSQSPPTLAPGAMSLLGFMGLLYTLRHPAISIGKGPGSSITGEE